MGGRSGKGPQPGNWAGSGCVSCGGAKQAVCGWGDAGNAPGQGVEAPGQLACAPRPLPTPLPPAHRIPSPTGSAASSRHGDRWRGVTKAPPLGRAPASLRRGARRSQCAFCFGYREAGFGHGASLLPWARNGQERPAAGSGTRRVITFSPPGRAPRLPDSPPQQNLRAAFGFLLSFPRRAGDTIPFGDLLFTLSNNTHRHTDQVSDSGGRTKEQENPVFSTGWEKIPGSQKVQTRQGWRSKRCGVDSAPSPSLLSAWCQPAPSPNHHTGKEPRRVQGPGKPPSSPTTPAALKFDPKEFRIRFQNTAEPSRTNTPQLPRPRREPQRAG